jgi:DNA-binding response OmpR family regulator
VTSLLIVEDEQLIAAMLAEWLEDMNYEVIGPAKSNEEALALLSRSTPDAAILDILVEDGNSYAVARELQRRAVPFFFATGYSGEEIDASFTDASVAMKPFEFDRLCEMLTRVLTLVVGSNSRAGANLRSQRHEPANS